MILTQPKGYETMIGAQNETGLSAGQRQLIGLSRALFGRPVILLLDEPTANLDPDSAERVIENLRKAAEADTIVIVATHDEKLIAATDTVLLIREGSLLSARSEDYIRTSKLKPGDNVTPFGARAS